MENGKKNFREARKFFYCYFFFSSSVLLLRMASDLAFNSLKKSVSTMSETCFSRLAWSISMRNAAKPYHPLFNSPVWRAVCLTSARYAGSADALP